MEDWIKSYLYRGSKFQCQGRSLVECHSAGESAWSSSRMWIRTSSPHSKLMVMGVRVLESHTISMRTWYISSTPICQVGSSGGSTHRSLQVFQVKWEITAFRVEWWQSRTGCFLPPMLLYRILDRGFESLLVAARSIVAE